MGLVEYTSSDEEGADNKPQLNKNQPQLAPAHVSIKQADEAATKEEIIEARLSNQSLTTHKNDSTKLEPSIIGPVPQSAIPLGPSLPPIDDASITNLNLPEPDEDQEKPLSRAPASPYSSTRALIHDLTLPSIPNLDIPPSPPGSPPPDTTKKLEQFLALKRKATHFNSKIDQSSALKNPSLMDKLLDYAGIDDASQYETTLPPDLWDPSAFPPWAFRDRLKKSREKLAKEKEGDRAAGGRTAVDFVPSISSSSGGSGGVWSGGLSRGEKRKGGWK